MWEQIIRVDLATGVPKLDLPICFFHGVYDYTCSFTLAEEYFRTLRALLKGFYRFEGSDTIRFSKSRSRRGRS